MAVETHADAVGEVRLAGAANGVALTTTAAFTSFPSGTNYITLMPRNVVTAVVVRYALCPWLVVLKTSDALVAASNITDGSEALQDNDTATTLSLNSLDTAANGDFIYVGARQPFRGVRVIIGNSNSVGASTLTVKYWNGSAWANITATDGTTGGGDTFNTSGNVTWTVPTAWAVTSLRVAGDTLLRAPAVLDDPTIYWTRWETSAAFDATVTATGMQSMARSTVYGEFDVGVGKEMKVARVLGGTSCIEALTDAGTANLLVLCETLGVGSNFLIP